MSWKLLSYFSFHNQQHYNYDILVENMVTMVFGLGVSLLQTYKLKNEFAMMGLFLTLTHTEA